MNRNSKNLLGILGGVGAGAALMYFMDPDRGRTRRASVRDKAAGLSNDLTDSVNRHTEDLKNRASGLLHEATGVFKRGEENAESTGGGFAPADGPMTH